MGAVPGGAMNAGGVAATTGKAPGGTKNETNNLYNSVNLRSPFVITKSTTQPST